MSRYQEFEGKDLEEALDAASEGLGIPQDDIHYRLIDEGRRGVFGLGARSVRIGVEAPASPPPARRQERKRRPAAASASPPPPVPEELDVFEVEEEEPGDEPVEVADSDPELEGLVTTVDRMMELMSIRLRATATNSRGGARLKLDGKDRKMLLHKDAEFLNALQFLLNRMSRRAWPEAGRIQVVCEGHRNRRDGELVEEIREVAGQVARTGRTKRLQPMNPYERRLVHLTIREYPDLETESEGDGFMKTIKVCRVQSD